MIESRLDLDALAFDEAGGLVTVVTQDAVTGAVLMIAHADRTALERTIATGEMHYRSRTRGPWHKGAASGNVQQVESLDADCDGDAVLARVRVAGPACHSGTVTCFGAGSSDAIGTADAIIAERVRRRSAGSDNVAGYTGRLLADRNLRLKKLGEEAAELIAACADGDRERAAAEAADFFYHALVALHSIGGSLDDVRLELSLRRVAALETHQEKAIHL